MKTLLTILFGLSLAATIHEWEIGLVGMAICLGLLFGLRKPRIAPRKTFPLRWRYESFIYEKGVRKGIVE